MERPEMGAQHAPVILVVDDDIETLELIEAVFKPKGYLVRKFEDGATLMQEHLTKGLVGDVLLIDLFLPNSSGLELTKTLVESNINIPIIVITADGSVQNAIQAIEGGAYDFVVKPIHFPQLLITIERAIHFQMLKKQNEKLIATVKTNTGFGIPGVVGKSVGFLKAVDLAKRVSSSSANVFIHGESGAGKEVIAKIIHHAGSRKSHPFVAINCSSIPENLLESELFGHAKGAFTGATDKKIGLFEEANGGTLFLDEIGDLSFTLQAKLLRVIQERNIRRIGENTFRPIDTRIISATHRNLRQEIIDRRFRQDLFFRLNVIQISVPPLRERREDIIPLADFFFQKYTALNGSRVKRISRAVYERLMQYSWPGNVRELENTIERAVVLSSSDEVTLDDLSDEVNQCTPQENQTKALETVEEIKSSSIMTMDQMTKRYILQVLKKNNWAKEKTAKDLDIDRKTLYRKLQEIDEVKQQQEVLDS